MTYPRALGLGHVHRNAGESHVVYVLVRYIRLQIETLERMLEYQDQANPDTVTVSFIRKARALFTTLFQKPPDFESIDWLSCQEGEWEWSKVAVNEVKEAI